MPALVGSWDTNIRNRFGNSAYVDWFGIAPEKMRGKHMSEIIGADRFKQIEPRLLSVLQGYAEVFERTIEFPSGEKRHAVFSYVPEIEGGVVKGFYGFINDVTPLKEAHIAKEIVLAQLQGIVDAAQDFSIIAGDENGLITLFSKGAEILLGYTADEIIGKVHHGIFHVADEVIARGEELTLQLGRPIRGFDVFVEAARQGGSESREWTYVRKDGGTLPVNLTVTAIRDGSANITGYLGIAKNISKDKEILRTLAETRDKAQAASLSKSQFLANMSHEIRTPMNAILGMLQLLQHTELTSRQLDYAVKTQTAARSLLGLLNDILDFSKVEADKMVLEHAPFRIDTLMRELSVIFSSSIGNKDVEVLFAIDPKLPACVVGDALRLRQILINLAGNAIKFTKQGEVVVSLQVVKQADDRTEIEFAVRDSGIGISPEQLAYVFEGFSQAEASTTRRFGGTGLGLAISQRLVSLMGGELFVKSEFGVGSHFYFTLSFENTKDDAIPSAPSNPIANQQLRALVVDDNYSAREVLLSMINTLGWHGESAGSGSDALAMLQRSATGPFPFDVVFMDWKMPDMDGWEATDRIRQLQHGRDAPIVIMVTAHGRELLAERLQTQRNLLNGFLVKPITASMLLDAVIDASQLPLRVAAKKGEMRLAGLRLLVVEDTIMNQQVAQELLMSEGAYVEVADGGITGVEKAVTAQPPFDAVLMDIQMPDMDGYVATGKIRLVLGTHTPHIIAMTANAMAADKAACLAAGMSDHIGKPVDLDVLVNTILLHCGAKNVNLSPVVSENSTLLQDFEGIALDIALRRLGGDKWLFANLARRFGPDMDALAADLRRSMECGDQAKMAMLTHSLKGTAGTMGATALAEYAASVELQLKSNDVMRDMDIVMAEFEALICSSTAALGKIALNLSSTILDSSSATTDADKVPLATMLDNLDTHLKSANMQAISVFAVIEKTHGVALGDRLAPLAHCINRLDFKAALECSNQLRIGLQ